MKSTTMMLCLGLIGAIFIPATATAAPLQCGMDAPPPLKEVCEPPEGPPSPAEFDISGDNNCDEACTPIQRDFTVVDPSAPGFVLNHPGVFIVTCEVETVTYPFIDVSGQPNCPLGEAVAVNTLVPADSLETPGIGEITLGIGFGFCEKEVTAMVLGFGFDEQPAETPCASVLTTSAGPHDTGCSDLQDMLQTDWTVPVPCASQASLAP